MIGTRGVPPRYGGFETAVDEIGKRIAGAGHEVIVYCRNSPRSGTVYGGMTLVNLPYIPRRSLETLSHSAISGLHASIVARPDVAVVFNSANGPILPLLKVARIPAAVHTDGLEWKRSKWSPLGRRYYRWAEQFSVKHANAVIADAQAIQVHIETSYGRDSWFLPYGAPIIERDDNAVADLGLASQRYHLVVARFEPENHVDLIIKGYLAADARWPLVIVGSTKYSTPYGSRISDLASRHPLIRLLGPVWNPSLLDQLYANAGTYIHGHSVGGTNPSLLRAMGAGAPITAFDVVFNREVTGGHAAFFGSPDQLGNIIRSDEKDAHRARGLEGQQHVATRYNWDEVANGYLALASALSRDGLR